MLNNRMGVSVDEVCAGMMHLPLLVQPERMIGRLYPLFLRSVCRKSYSITVRPKHHYQQHCKDGCTEESAQGHNIRSCFVEAKAHEVSSKSPRHTEDSPYRPKDRSIRTKPKVATRQVRNNVYLGSYASPTRRAAINA